MERYDPIDEEALRNAEFEQMLDEIKHLKHREKLAAELLEGWADNVVIPDKNCSCHISPPCNDCYEWGFLRDLAEGTARFIKEAKDATVQRTL